MSAPEFGATDAHTEFAADVNAACASCQAKSTTVPVASIGVLIISQEPRTGLSTASFMIAESMDLTLKTIFM